jgi:hypothetical protein
MKKVNILKHKKSNKNNKNNNKFKSKKDFKKRRKIRKRKEMFKMKGCGDEQENEGIGMVNDVIQPHIILKYIKLCEKKFKIIYQLEKINKYNEIQNQLNKIDEQLVLTDSIRLNNNCYEVRMLKMKLDQLHSTLMLLQECEERQIDKIITLFRKHFDRIKDRINIVKKKKLTELKEECFRDFLKLKLHLKLVRVLKKVYFLKSGKGKEILEKLQTAKALAGEEQVALALAKVDVEGLQKIINDNIKQGKPFFLDDETTKLVNALFKKIKIPK